MGKTLKLRSLAVVSVVIWVLTTAAYPAWANEAPIAENLRLKDPVRIGQSISIYYDYTDADSDSEGATRFAWYRSTDRTFDAGDTTIVGATNSTYTLQTADRLHYLFCRVTPVAISGVLEGSAVVSEPSERVGGIAVTSSAFTHNAYIPVEHAFFNGNVSIPLQWTAVSGAAQYSLRFYDRDDLDYVHWSVDGIPASTLR